MKKKIFTLLLAVAASVGTMFAEKVKIGDLYYNLDATNHTAEVTHRLEWDANNYSGLTTAIIPDSVTYNSETYSVTSIGNDAFYNCSGLTSVAIPNSVTSIGELAFYGCRGLTSIEIPNSVTSIGNEAFSGCRGLTSINVVTDNPNYCSVEDVLFNKDKTVLVLCAAGKEGDYTIPNSVTSIGISAFYRCTGLTSVTIPNSVTSIGELAFYKSNLKNVIIGSSVKVLEKSAFYSCSAIETITCYGQRPPTVKENALYGLDYGTIVYVPADYLETYKMHDAWGLYDVRPLGAKSTETADLKVTPAQNTADVVWPAVSGAATYELVIKDKSGNVICTLIFNANGQLTQIAFNAPARNNAPQQTQAAGFSFTVTGLDEGTPYVLTIDVKDSAGKILQTFTQNFTTLGATGIDDVSAHINAPHAKKTIGNGIVYILLPDGRRYNLQGTEVK